MSDPVLWFFLYVAPWISAAVILLYLWARFMQPEPNGYAEWVADIKSRNPEWQEPWLSNGARNPLWKPGQTVKNADGTTYTFDE